MRRERLLLAGLLMLGAAAPAHAYDPQSTQVGLVQKAALRAALHKVLAQQLGRPLGLFEPVRGTTPVAGATDALHLRLESLDPAVGVRPENGVASAIAWVGAGAVLSETPPERGRHHFLDPQTHAGLQDDPGATGFLHALRMSVDGGSGLRDLATATAFDLTGRPVLGWLLSPDNDLSLPVFFTGLEQAATAPKSADRDAGLARALMSLGAIAAALADMGDPAHVRNDFREAHLNHHEIGAWDRRSAYDAFVMQHYGRDGVPESEKTVARPNFESFFTAPDGEGLADRTQRRFFSDGTRPEDVSVGPESTTREVLAQATASLRYASPAVTGLDLRRGGVRRYVMQDGRRLLGYVRLPGLIQFFLDDKIFADTAAAVLPEIGGYVTGLIDHLLRARLSLQVEGRALQIQVQGLSGGLRDGTLQLYAEDEQGTRRPIGTPMVFENADVSAAISVTVPPDVSKVAVCLRGHDHAGAFVAQSQILAP